MSVIFVIILVATIVISYQGFNNYPFFNRYKFNVREVKRGDYIRLISSGFLHADWSHLIFNMLSLYFFQGIIVQTMGSFLFLVIYFGSMLLGSVFSLYIYRNQSYYSAIGASGAVSGIVFAAIALFPDSIRVNFMPGWIFGTIYFGYSAYMMLNPQRGDNLGHSAHLGGAFFVLIVVLLYNPLLVIQHTFYLGAMALPLIYIGYKLLKK